MFFAKSRTANAADASTIPPQPLTAIPSPVRDSFDSSDLGVVSPTSSAGDIKEDEKSIEEFNRPPGDESRQAKESADIVPVDSQDESIYPPMRKVIVIAVALYMAMFLVALDRTIVATAIPKLTDEFNSFGDIGWYGSAYLLTLCAFQLIYGRIYNFYDPKIIFLANVFVFEVGSAVCGAAPNSTTFIVGRAIAGFGSAGIFSGVIIVIMHIVPLRKRPMFQASMGAVFGISSVLGPLLGGVFTSDVSWRWCFYINLPVGAIAFILLVWLLELPDSVRNKAKVPFKEQIKRLDPIGTAFFIPGSICLLLALQWGGSTYAWSSWRIILLLVLFSLCCVTFVGVQIWKRDTATVPPRIISQRSILAGVMYTMCIGSSMMLIIYYFPTYLQAVQNISPIKSGIYTIPLVAALVVSSTLSGAFVQKVGYYTPSMILCSCIMSIGAGLFLLLTPHTSKATFLGIQVVFGFGLGLGMQQAGLAAQTVLSKSDASIGISLIFFGQTLGGAIFISVGQNVLNSKLIAGISALRIPGFDVSSIVKVGATDLRHVVPAAFLPAVLDAYNAALLDVFKVATAISAVSLLAALAMEWRSIKGVRRGASGADAA